MTQRDSVTQKNKITASPFRPARNGQWNTFTYAFRINEGSARLYLFSGKHSQEAVTSLRNIQIHELNSVRSVNLTDAGLLSTGPNAYEAGSISTQAMTQSQVPVPPLADWRQGDCNALDDTPTVDFTHLDDGIELTGRDGHNACIRLITDINTNYSYSIDFDYYSTGVSGDFKLAYMYDPDFPLKKYAEPRVQNQWRHVTLRPSTPEEATNLTLYLYSGTNKKGTAGVKYRNFTIKRLPKTFTDNSLITHNTSANSEQKVKSIEIAPHLYKVTATSVTSGFFINFLEPYHDGWQLAVEGNKSDSSKIIPFHLAANLETNAWYVDVDKLCKVQKLCQTNSDGSYSIAMVATFTPHRYFYLGVGVSGIALVGCLGYLLWSRWRRRQR